MITNDEEVEIKIEYFDNNENDPLSESIEESTNVKVKYESDDVPVNHDSYQNDRSMIKCVTENHLENKRERNEVPINHISNDNKSQQKPVEDLPKWYKSIDSCGRYNCSFCELAYVTVASLRRHIRLKHNTDAGNLKTTIFNNRRTKKHTCHVCKRRFSCLQHLINHVRDLHDIENDHSCHICLAQFPTHEEKLDHFINIHDMKMKSAYVCKICGYQTLKISHLNQHRNTHSQENKKKCTYCNYSTNHLPNLRTHERIHIKEFPYVCDYKGCSYQSASKSGLSSHKLKHYPDENMLFCDKCSYSTVYKLSLKKHIVSHSRNSIIIKKKIK